MRFNKKQAEAAEALGIIGESTDEVATRSWVVLEDWAEHEFSDVTEDEFRVLFNTYTGERKFESRPLKGGAK